MLNVLRKRAQSTLIQILVLIIALVFIFWGVGTNLGTKRNALATVNGYEIPYDDYRRTYDNTVDNLRVQFGGTIPQGFLDGLGIRQQVLQQLVRAELLRQGGREMGIQVSSVSTQDEIKKMEVFQSNGQFDIDRYKQILSQNRMTPTSFEAGLQNDLLAAKVTEAIQRFAVVPESEVLARINFDNEQIQLEYAAVKSSDYVEKVVVDDEKLAEWFEEHKNNYLTEPQIRLKYMFFSAKDDLEQVELPEDKIKAEYERNIQQYTTPEQRHARHILFRVNETDDAQVRAEKKAKAEEVLVKAKAGEDFAELAKKYSEGPTGPAGGDLGFFNKGSMVKQFDEKVFQMEPGDISDIVETVFGYHIILLEAIRPEVIKSYQDVRDDISLQLQQQDVKEISRQKAKKAYEDIIRSGSLDNYKEQTGGDVRETDYFQQSLPPGAPLNDPKILQVSFQLKKGELSSLVESTDGYAILFVDDIKPPEVPELTTVREKVVEDYTKATSLELAKDAAEKLLQESVKSGTFDSKTLGDQLKRSEYITRSNPSEAADIPAQVIQEAFRLSGKDSFPEQPVSQGEEFYVFQVVERRQASDSIDETQKGQVVEQLAQAAKNRLYENWLAWMQSNADIWINEQILQ